LYPVRCALRNVPFWIAKPFILSIMRFYTANYYISLVHCILLTKTSYDEENLTVHWWLVQERETRSSLKSCKTGRNSSWFSDVRNAKDWRPYCELWYLLPKILRQDNVTELYRICTNEANDGAVVCSSSMR